MHTCGEGMKRGLPNAVFWIPHGCRCNLVVFNYRGVGRSQPPWPATQEDLYGDARAVYRALVANGVDPERILIYGHSLGSGSVLWGLSFVIASLTCPARQSIRILSRQNISYQGVSLLQGRDCQARVCWSPTRQRTTRGFNHRLSNRVRTHDMGRLLGGVWDCRLRPRHPSSSHVLPGIQSRGYPAFNPGTLTGFAPEPLNGQYQGGDGGCLAQKITGVCPHMCC